MRKINFDYPDTCPKIDRVARKLFEHVSSLVENTSSIFDNHFWYLIDEFRDINTAMRIEADNQIRSLKREVEELEIEMTLAKDYAEKAYDEGYNEGWWDGEK